MKNEKYILLLKLIIFYFDTLNALMGRSVRRSQENEFPSLAAIVHYNPRLSWEQKFQCTGTLVVSDYILSAAHCFYDANRTRYEIYLGGYVVKRGEIYFPVWWITFDQWVSIFNPNHVARILVDDLLLIKIVGINLERFASGIRGISPVNLMYGLDALIVGCGKKANDELPRHMQVGTVTIMDHATCSSLVSTRRGQDITIPESYICSKGDPYTQLRVGDSGGPLMYFGEVIGINIACYPDVRGPFDPHRINIHANIQQYRSFIQHCMNLVIRD